MNCRQSERKILFAESGELSNRELEKLEEHLSACQHCRQYRKSLRHIVSTAKDALPAGEPRAAVLSRIRAAAEERIASKTILVRLCPALWDYVEHIRHPIMAQGLAYAAALALLVGGWFMLSSNGRSERISELNTILAMMSEEAFDEAEYSEESGRSEQLRALANQLLLIEGLAVDDLTDVEFSTPHAEPQPTALRLRSTAGPQPRKCV